MKNLNIYLADLWAANIALHNYHWNVKGPNFMPVHEFTEGLYDYLFEEADAVAELIVQLGEVPASTLKEYTELATITEDESKDISCHDATKKTLEVLKSLNESAKAIADEADHFLVVNLMEDHMTEYVKNIWFLEATLTEI